MSRIIYICFLFTVIVSPFLSVRNLLANSSDSLIIYVWEFATRDGTVDEMTSNFTEEFEEALIQSNCCTVLQRRHYSRIFEQFQNEKAIQKLENVPSSALDSLQTIEANAVVFGEVYYDVQSGLVRVSINIESLSDMGVILEKASVQMPRYDLPNPFRRNESMKELIKGLGFFTSSSKIYPGLIDYIDIGAWPERIGNKQTAKRIRWLTWGGASLCVVSLTAKNILENNRNKQITSKQGSYDTAAKIASIVAITSLASVTIGFGYNGVTVSIGRKQGFQLEPR